MKLAYVAITGLIVLVGAGVYLVVQNENEGQKQEMLADFDRKLQQQKSEFNQTAAELEKKLKAATETVKPELANAAAEAVKDPAVRIALEEVKKGVLSGSKGTGPGNGVAAPEPPNLSGDTVSADEQAAIDEQKILDSAGLDDRIARERAQITTGGTDDNGEKLNDVQSLILAQPRIARVGDARAADKDGFIVLDEGLNKGLRKGDRFAVRRGTILVARIVVGGTVEPTQCVADIVPNTLVAGMNIKNGDDIIKFDR